MRSILETVFNIRELQMFSTTIQIARLSRTLHSAGPFTVFAPSDLAFTKLSTAVLKQLTSNVSVLKNTIDTHIVSGNFTYQDLLKMCQQGEQSAILTSLAGSPLYIDLSDGIRIGSSTVITTDIHAENGVIHSIDRFILPKEPQQLKTVGWMNEFSSR
jgi:uncharacterized surface protein with fasciclin (FAS1) repeats